MTKIFTLKIKLSDIFKKFIEPFDKSIDNLSKRKVSTISTIFLVYTLLALFFLVYRLILEIIDSRIYFHTPIINPLLVFISFTILYLISRSNYYNLPIRLNILFFLIYPWIREPTLYEPENYLTSFNPHMSIALAILFGYMLFSVKEVALITIIGVIDLIFVYQFHLNLGIDGLMVKILFLFGLFLISYFGSKFRLIEYEEQRDYYSGLFNHSPIPIIEHDFSKIKITLNDLNNKGVTNLKNYFDVNLDEYEKFTSLINISTCNKATLALYKVKTIDSYRDLINSKITNKIDTSFNIDILERFFKGEKIVNIKTDLAISSNEKLHVIIRAEIPPDSMENWNRILVSIIDISQLKRAEKKQQDLIRSLEIANKELEDFALVASHDLRAPLRQIKSLLNYPVMRPIANEGSAHEEIFNLINGSITNMENLVTELLEFAKIIKSERKFSFLKSDEIIKEALRNIDLEIKEKNAKIVIKNPCTINGISSCLISLFQNLVLNGIKFNKSAIPEVIINCETRPNSIEIQITDNGIGIPQSHFVSIFSIFTTLYSKNEYPGTGIGLASCKKIVEIHNGRIWVNSELRKGSTFFISLPN